jgi:hypothetical protein
MERTKLGTMPLHGLFQLQGLFPSYYLCVIKRFFLYVAFRDDTQIPIFFKVLFRIWPIHGSRYKGSFEEGNLHEDSCAFLHILVL